jgi:chloramphenicol 3-O phosphotransferase
VLVLNGGSSSGKSTVGRQLQDLLDGFWLRLGVDTLIDLAPPRILQGGDGLELAADGGVHAGPGFVELEDQWITGVAAMASAGARLIIEDNFLGGVAGQRRWREALGELPIGWVGVRCAAAVAAAREAARGDRITGMAARQADAVHEGIEYDLEVDAARSTPDRLAVEIVEFFGLAARLDQETNSVSTGPDRSYGRRS